MSRNTTSSKHSLSITFGVPFHQVAVPAIQVSVPVTFQLLPSTAGALDITFFRVWDVTDVTDPTLVGSVDCVSHML